MILTKSVASDNNVTFGASSMLKLDFRIAGTPELCFHKSVETCKFVVQSGLINNW